MISLDSVYAMLAKPVTAKVKAKKKIKPMDASSAINADSQERPQTQLPDHLERRSATNDRRQAALPELPLEPRLERRKGSRRDRRQSLEPQTIEAAQDNYTEDTHTKIDINI